MSTNIPIRADINSQSFEVVKTQLTEIARRAGMSEKEINDMNDAIEQSGKKSKKATDEASKGFGGLNAQMGNLAKGVASAFSVALVMQFASKVVAVTANFQKMEAVLKTALGSQSAAQVSMRMLKDFASNTPFQVDKLTDSYVKLVNQGFKPTRAELTKLGDFAASMGKEFDQLTEAIIDAQVGEFERLKEFGVRAQKEGDRVKFTFKGVTTEVQNSEKAIRDYILSLGDAEGVMGSMAAVSETVGGKLSNLDDNFTNLFATIGDSSSGLIAGILDLSNNALSSLTSRLDAVNMVTKNDSGIMAFFKTMMAFTDPAYAVGIEMAAHGMRVLAEEQQNAIDAGRAVFEAEGKQRAAAYEALEREKQIRAEAAKKAAEKLAQEQARINALGVIGKLEHEISELQKQRAFVTGPAELARINKQIEKRREEIAIIELMAKDIVAPSLGNPFEAMDKGTKDAFDAMVKNQKKAFDESIKNGLAWMEANKDLTQRVKDFWRDWSDQLSYTALDTYMMIEERGRQNTENEVNRLDQEKQTKLSLAGEDREQQILIEEEFQAKKEALRAKERSRLLREAIAQRGLTLFNIFRNTSEASIAALAPPPIGFGPVAGIPASIGIKALGVLQAASVIAAPLPKFKDGVLDLKGPGSETSDSIHAMLSRGESVIPARKTREFRDLLKPIIEDDHVTYEKLMGIILDKVPLKMRGDLMGAGRPKTEDGRLLSEIQGLRSDMRSQSTQIVVDQAGATVRNKRHGRVVKTTYDFLYG
jgi:hypothetical protein